MNTAQMILEYLRVLFSGPVIIGAVALTFIGVFRPKIGRLIDRLSQIKFPGGELSASQQERSRELEEAAPNQAAQAAAPALSAGPIPNKPEEVQQLINSERANAALWEYRYLNHYLVRSTQLVLDWLAAQPQPVSLRLLDTYLQSIIRDANERTAIIGALQNHHLIILNGDAITVTEKGREYLRWRGPLLPAPAA